MAWSDPDFGGTDPTLLTDPFDRVRIRWVAPYVFPINLPVKAGGLSAAGVTLSDM